MKSSKKAIPTDCLYDEWNSINDCKKRFLNYNGEPTKMAPITSDVAKSWIRSKKWGIDPFASRIKEIADNQELQKLLASNKLFIETAVSSIKRFNRLLLISGYCIFITDKEGTVLFNQHHHAGLEKEMFFQVGVMLNEKAIGTTATCLSIIHKKPYQLLGPCNYLALFKYTVYSSVPIFNSERELIGTIGVVHSLEQRDLPDLNDMVSDWVSAVAENVEQNMTAALKQSKLEQTCHLLQKTLATVEQGTQRRNNNEGYSFNSIIGKSPAIIHAVSTAKTIAHSKINILLHGESGTGKELFAQSIHQSACPEGPFIALNCAALPKNLLESELFGYEGGAFTGAEKKGRPGKFELANEGTILLDEIGDMPIEFQPALLRVLEEKKIMRVGGVKYVPIKVRVIAATHRNLLQMVQENKFREDLYFRLSAFTIEIPPLRKREHDVLLLARYYIERVCQTENRKVPQLSEEACKTISRYTWPGNVRQLENAMIYAVYMSENSVILDKDLPCEIVSAIHMPKDANSNEESKNDCVAEGKRSFNQSEMLQEVEKKAIKDVLSKTRFNTFEAAKLLGISRSTVYRKMRDYHIKKISWMEEIS